MHVCYVKYLAFDVAGWFGLTSRGLTKRFEHGGCSQNWFAWLYSAVKNGENNNQQYTCMSSKRNPTLTAATKNATNGATANAIATSETAFALAISKMNAIAASTTRALISTMTKKIAAATAILRLMRLQWAQQRGRWRGESLRRWR